MKFEFKVFIGIDVGKDGGIAAIRDDGEVRLYTIPRIGNLVDNKALFEILYRFKPYEVIVCLEDVHGIVGASTKATFNFGEIKGKKIGMIEALACIEGFVYTMVQPKVWQKAIWITPDIVYKPKKPDAKTDRKRVDTKKTSLLAAKRLFPTTDFRASDRCKNDHDGLVDAALIALYLKNTYK